jgi:hypothetical protein
MNYGSFPLKKGRIFAAPPCMAQATSYRRLRGSSLKMLYLSSQLKPVFSELYCKACRKRRLKSFSNFAYLAKSSMILSLSFRSFALLSTDDIMLLRDPITNEKKQTPNNIHRIARAYSISVTLVMSPYPTVDIVVIDQYSEARYRVPRSSSIYPPRVTQVSGPNPSILAQRYHRQAMICAHTATVQNTRSSRMLLCRNERKSFIFCVNPLRPFPFVRNLISFEILTNR